MPLSATPGADRWAATDLAPLPVIQRSGTSRPRVLHHPRHDPYVDRLADCATRIEAPASAAQATDPSWIRDHAGHWDIVHLHLGLDREMTAELADGQLAEVAKAHRQAGVPVVVTVHQLHPGHLPNDSPAVIDALREAEPWITELLTLTPGCATAIRAVTGRVARVVPHGPVVPEARRRRMRGHRRRALSGHSHLLVHVPALDPNLGLEELAAACELVRPDRVIRIQAHPDVLTEVRRQFDGVQDVEVVEFSTDHRQSRDGRAPVGGDSVGGDSGGRALERAVADAAALILPLRWGSHSPLIELASDVGTPVITTTAGYLVEQLAQTVPGRGPDDLGPEDESPHIGVWNGRLDVPRLAKVLARPVEDAPMVTECERERSAHAFRSHHERLYHRLRTGVIDLGRS